MITLSERIAQESAEANVAHEMKSSLDNCLKLFHQIEQSLPLTLSRNKALLGYLQRFEEATQKCHQWFNEAKQLFSRYSIQVPVEKIEKYLEQNRVRALNEVQWTFLFCFRLAVELFLSNGSISTDCG